MRLSVSRLALVCAAALPWALAGCNGPLTKDAPELYDMDIAETVPREEQVRGPDDPAIVTLKIGNALRDRRLKGEEGLPDDVTLDRIDLDGVPLMAALQGLVANLDIPVSVDEAAGKDVSTRPVTVYNLSGPLPRVVGRICQVGRVFCSYRDGLLEISNEETFVIDLPPIAKDAENTIATAIENLAGGEVIIDSTGGNIIFTADVQGHRRVSEYLEQLRNGRPLVVLQVYIWEVTLSNATGAGINWRNSKLLNTDFLELDSGIGLTNATDTASIATNPLNADSIADSISFGAVFSGPINASSIFSFLSTQGSVQTVSNPQLTFVSGSEATFTIGGEETYVSEVGQLVTNNVTGDGTSSTAVGENTVKTEKLETGLTITTSGSYESGVFLGTLEIEETLLLELDSITTAGATLQLPRTQKRELKTVLRVRPGDNLVLAGLKSSRDNRSRRNLPLGFVDVPIQDSTAQENRELVILIRPSVVLFSDKDEDAPQIAGGDVDWPAPVVIQGGAADAATATAQGLGTGAAAGGTPEDPGAPQPLGTLPAAADGLSPVVIPAPESLQNQPPILPRTADAATALEEAPVLRPALRAPALQNSEAADDSVIGAGNLQSGFDEALGALAPGAAAGTAAGGAR